MWLRSTPRFGGLGTGLHIKTFVSPSGDLKTFQGEVKEEHELDSVVLNCVGGQGHLKPRENMPKRAPPHKMFDQQKSPPFKKKTNN